MRKFKFTFWLSTVCMGLMSLSFLFMPIASAKSAKGETGWSVLSGFLFWIPLIMGYILAFLTNQIRKSKIRKRNRVRQGLSQRVKAWGIFQKAAFFQIRVLDGIFILSMIGFIALLNSESYSIYIFLCLAVFSFHMHCMFSGVNYQAVTRRKRP